MIITADRAHAPGEQIFISYGLRPNPLLFRNYGFTLPPDMEPSWCFVLQGLKPRELYDAFLPRRYNELNIHLDTHSIQNSLIDALNGCGEMGRDARQFLLEVCVFCRKAYECDPL